MVIQAVTLLRRKLGVLSKYRKKYQRIFGEYVSAKNLVNMAKEMAVNRPLA